MYVCVSYTWGPPAPMKEIRINGATFKVRQNLYDLLLQLYDMQIDENVYFWIDQISIDQNNVLERNSQVKIMDQIFCNAAQVVVWLGPSADGSDRAMKVLESRRRLQLYLDGSGNRDEKRAFRALFRRPYWGRLWVVQELMLSRRLLLLCGSIMVPWVAVETYFMVPRTLTTTDKRLRFDPDNNHGGVRGLILARASFDGGFDRLSYVLTMFSGSRCEDQRDKVYGLLSLVPKHLRIEIDYWKSLKDIYLDAMRAIIKCEWYLDIRSLTDLAMSISGKVELGFERHKMEAWILRTSRLFRESETLEAVSVDRGHLRRIASDSNFHFAAGNLLRRTQNAAVQQHEHLISHRRSLDSLIFRYQQLNDL